MGFNGKHLSLEDRKIIENNIGKGLRKFETAKELNKAQSTIGKEIRNNRKRKYSQLEDSPFMCNHFKECKVCTSKCKDFEEIPCLRRDRFIGACNNCPEIKKCRKAKYFYYAYDDSLNFVKNNPDMTTAEMDTVYNQQDGPYIQTFIFENTGLMIGLLKQHKTSEDMSNSLNYFQDILSDDMYHKLFGLILTTRGNEFARPQLFEINHETGEIRTNIFYCDAQTPSQKPHVENNHEFIRNIIYKKKSMKD